MDDRRNWKCFIGMHQFSEHGRPRVDGILYKSETHVLKCDFCGKLKVVKFELT